MLDRAPILRAQSPEVQKKVLKKTLKNLRPRTPEVLVDT